MFIIVGNSYRRSSGVHLKYCHFTYIVLFCLVFCLISVLLFARAMFTLKLFLSTSYPVRKAQFNYWLECLIFIEVALSISNSVILYNWDGTWTQAVVLSFSSENDWIFSTRLLILTLPFIRLSMCCGAERKPGRFNHLLMGNRKVRQVLRTLGNVCYFFFCCFRPFILFCLLCCFWQSKTEYGAVGVAGGSERESQCGERRIVLGTRLAGTIVHLSHWAGGDQTVHTPFSGILLGSAGKGSCSWAVLFGHTDKLGGPAGGGLKKNKKEHAQSHDRLTVWVVKVLPFELSIKCAVKVCHCPALVALFPLLCLLS